MIRFQDLSRLHGSIADELRAAFERTLADSAFIQGEPVATFEKQFAVYTGAAHCMGVGNGTDALELALQALKLPRGAVVIVPAMTFAASAEAVVRQGLRPHFADVDRATLCIGPRQLEEAIASAPGQVRALIAVHLYGRVSLSSELLEVVDRHRIALVEDCAQAHGARYAGRHVGLAGRLGCFSFYPGKNLGALGDGGAVITDDTVLAERVRSLRDHGRTSKYLHGEVGRNSRLDGLQARFLTVKLGHLDAWTAARRRLADGYAGRLARLCWLQPLVRAQEPAQHVHHLYVVRIRGGEQQRDALLRHLDAASISCGIHYPVPLHKQPAFAHLASGALPEAEAGAREILSLPMDPLMTEEDVERVCDVLGRFHA